MAARVYTEIEVPLTGPTGTKFLLRGRSPQDLARNLRREARRLGIWLDELASVIEGLAADGWRWRVINGTTLVFSHHRPQGKQETVAYLQRKFGRRVLRHISLRERVEMVEQKAPEGRGTGRAARLPRPTPQPPKAEDELTRELRRMIAAEEHPKELYLGHPQEELAELALDMNFLAQEALEDPEVAKFLEKLQEEHAQDKTYRDLHDRYFSLLDRLGSGDPAVDEAYWDLFSYTAHKLAPLIPVLRNYLERRGLTDLCEHEATSFLACALSQALTLMEERED
ncbi:MAG: hypothetical protein QN198_07915 [Armatimonadota bacterium]|nr:hypothetical protein [Armatimonadota bacterium]MDR5703513.1 hypothetical protein [Armatimonadota bacterium]MDR7434451.1 hypothetical protein [Armatimonadota bacterium]